MSVMALYVTFGTQEAAGKGENVPGSIAVKLCKQAFAQEHD